MYTDFYNLRGSPFRLNPDHRFFFVAEPHKKAMAHLRYALNRNEGFVVITGEVGAGKTTMVNRILSDLEESRYVTGNIVTSFVEHDNLLPLIARTFGIEEESTDKATLLLAIRDFLEEQRVLGQRPLLFVDEVQNLPASSLEELRMLSNFSLPGESLLQIFLVGQPEFRDTLADEGMEQLRQRVVTSCHLGTLGAEDTRSYIEHRLKLADWKGSPEFSERAFEAIHRLSEGVPRRINVICDRLLLHGFLEELDRFGSAAVASVAKDMTEEGLLTAPAVVKEPDRQAQPAAEQASPDEVSDAMPADALEPTGQQDASVLAANDTSTVTESAESPAEDVGDEAEADKPAAIDANADGDAASDSDSSAVPQLASDAEAPQSLEAEPPEPKTTPPAGESQPRDPDREDAPRLATKRVKEAAPMPAPRRRARLSGQALAQYALAASILIAALFLPESPLNLLRGSAPLEENETGAKIDFVEDATRQSDSLPAAAIEALLPKSADQPDQGELLFQEASDAAQDKLLPTSLSSGSANPDGATSDAVELALRTPSPLQEAEGQGRALSTAPGGPESLLKQGGTDPAPDKTGVQEDRFFIQLAALRSEDRASELKVQIHERFKDLLADYTLDVRKAEIAGTRYFRLMTVSGGDLDSMDRLCGEIKASGQDCILVLDTAQGAAVTD